MMRRSIRGQWLAPFQNRLVLLSWIVSGAFLGVLAGLLIAGDEGVPERFAYTEIEPPQPARDFTLENHRGEEFTLSDHFGDPVVLTFLYSSCTDVCPFVGEKLHQTIEILGDDARDVTFAAVTVDPERDARERVAEYSRSLGMYDRWHYLTGSKDALQPVWTAYYIRPTHGEEAGFATEEQLEEFGLTTGLTEEEIQSANAARFGFGGGYEVGHSTPVWLIDARGRIRVNAGPAFDPEVLADDIRRLSKASG